MNILVTGSAGQLGSALKRIAQGSAHRYVYTDIVAEDGIVSLDITSSDAVSSVMDREKIDIVINCAAFTDVNKAEDHPLEAERINALAPGILAEAVKARDALLIHISTDYVFDGSKNVPYNENDTASPLNVYGSTKLDGERNIIGSGCRYMIFRTSWLYYSKGNNFVKTMISKTASMPSVKVVQDQIGSPTNAYDLADMLCTIIDDGMTDKTGIYHYSNEGVCSWYDFAQEICSLAGHLCRIEPCSSDDFPSRAVRPKYSVLDKAKVRNTFGVTVPYWRDSLMLCMKEMSDMLMY